MKSIIVFIVGLLLLGSCGNKQESRVKQQKITAESMKVSIQEMDDSLRVLFDKAMDSPDFNISSAVYFEAINRNKNLYLKFPEDPYVETALDKVAAIYLQLNHEEEAAKWRDTLLRKFPNTKHRDGLLELQMNYYDYNEYNPEKIAYYLNKLLESKALSAEKREQFEYRLKHVDKTFEELIELQSNSISED